MSVEALLLSHLQDDCTTREISDISLPLCPSSLANESTILSFFPLMPASVSLLQCLLDAGNRHHEPALSKPTSWSDATTLSHTAAGLIFSWSSSNWLARLFGRHLTLHILPLLLLPPPLLLHVLRGDIKEPRLRLETELCLESQLTFDSEPPVLATSGWVYAAPTLSLAGRLQTSCCNTNTKLILTQAQTSGLIVLGTK